MLLLLLVACAETTITADAACSLDEAVLTPASAVPGELVVATTRPLTEVWDTAITVGAARAELVDFDRSTCDECDSCRVTEECTSCDECERCEETCATCVETVSFLVPDVAEGEWTVEIVNRHGRSDGVALTVLAPPVP